MGQHVGIDGLGLGAEPIEVHEVDLLGIEMLRPAAQVLAIAAPVDYGIQRFWTGKTAQVIQIVGAVVLLGELQVRPGAADRFAHDADQASPGEQSRAQGDVVVRHDQVTGALLAKESARGRGSIGVRGQQGGRRQEPGDVSRRRLQSV